MAPDQPTKKCKVRFFELRLLPHDEPAEGQRWSQTMTQLQNSTNCGRAGAHECDYNSVIVEGLPTSDGGHPRVALAVDRAVTPRQRNRVTSERSDLPIQPDHDVVEETFVSFFANNVVGIVQSTISAPSHVAVAAWLNEVAQPSFAGASARWHAVPIVDAEKYREIADADEVTSVTFALKPEDIPAGSGTVLGGFLTEGRDYGHGVRIEVKISTGRGRPGESAKGAIKRVARGLAGMHDEGVDLEKAQATVRRVYGEAVQPIDILHHRLARSADIPITQGRSLNQTAVFTETRVAYQTLRESILAAIGLS